MMDLRELIPRTRRAVEGPAVLPDGTAGRLTDDQVLALIADAVADVIFYTGGLFGHTLTATERDATYNAPTNWSVDPDLKLEEETVIIANAALSFFFHEFRDLKVHETIANEGASWDYDLSANLVLQQIKLLQEQRQQALDRILDSHHVPTVWVDTLWAREIAGIHAIQRFHELGVGGQAEVPPYFP